MGVYYPGMTLLWPPDDSGTFTLLKYSVVQVSAFFTLRRRQNPGATQVIVTKGYFSAGTRSARYGLK
jgi:hypothetical protein